MSNYQRLISYIYTYEGGIKGKNIGFAKLETRGAQCRITVSVKKIFVGGNPLGVYLLSEQKELKIGTLFARNGAGEFRATVNSADVENSGLGIEAFYGLSVHDVESAWRSYTTIWEDAVAHAAEVELADVTAENVIRKQNPPETKTEQELEGALPISREIEAELERESAETEQVEEKTVGVRGRAERRTDDSPAAGRENERGELIEAESYGGTAETEEFKETDSGTAQGKILQTPDYEEAQATESHESERIAEAGERRPEWRRSEERNRNWSKTAVRNLRESLMRDQAAISATPTVSHTPEEMMLEQQEPGWKNNSWQMQGPGPEIPTRPQGPGPEIPSPPEGPGPEIPPPPQGPGPEIPTRPQDSGPEIPSQPHNPVFENPWLIQDPGPVIPPQLQGPGPVILPQPQGPGPEIPLPPQSPGPERPRQPQGPGPAIPPQPQSPGPVIPPQPQSPGPEVPQQPQGPGPEVPRQPQGPGPVILPQPQAPGPELPPQPEPEIHTPQGPEPEPRQQVQEAVSFTTAPEMRQNQMYSRGNGPARRPFGTPSGRNRMGTVRQIPSGSTDLQAGAPNQQWEPIRGEEPPADSIPAVQEEKDSFTQDEMWAMLRKKYPKILAFDYADGCEILSIKPQDIGLLPREAWLYGNNSFLLHGYYNYRYLILARLNNPKGKPRYLLGIPGHYYSNEKYMAAMFGFPDFVLSKKQPSGDGRFGYWYTDIKVGE